MYSAGQAESFSRDMTSTIDAALKSNKPGKVKRHTFVRGLTSSTDDIYLTPGESASRTARFWA